MKNLIKLKIGGFMNERELIEKGEYREITVDAGMKDTRWKRKKGGVMKIKSRVVMAVVPYDEEMDCLLMKCDAFPQAVKVADLDYDNGAKFFEKQIKRYIRDELKAAPSLQIFVSNECLHLPKIPKSVKHEFNPENKYDVILNIPHDIEMLLSEKNNPKNERNVVFRMNLPVIFTKNKKDEKISFSVPMIEMLSKKPVKLEHGDFDKAVLEVKAFFEAVFSDICDKAPFFLSLVANDLIKINPHLNVYESVKDYVTEDEPSFEITILDA